MDQISLQSASSTNIVIRNNRLFYVCKTKIVAVYMRRSRKEKRWGEGKVRRKRREQNIVCRHTINETVQFNGVSLALFYHVRIHETNLPSLTIILQRVSYQICKLLTNVRPPPPITTLSPFIFPIFTMPSPPSSSLFSPCPLPHYPILSPTFPIIHYYPHHPLSLITIPNPTWFSLTLPHVDFTEVSMCYGGR